MYGFVLTLILIASVLLILVILIQNPKGGLAENFSSNNKIFGAQATGNIVEKTTWILGISIFVLVFLANIIATNSTDQSDQKESEINIENIE